VEDLPISLWLICRVIDVCRVARARRCSLLLASVHQLRQRSGRGQTRSLRSPVLTLADAAVAAQLRRRIPRIHSGGWVDLQAGLTLADEELRVCTYERHAYVVVLADQVVEFIEL
jgi:Mg-chelatase subunit ChlD